MKLKLGIIFCAFHNEKYVKLSLKPWLYLKRVERYPIKIAGVHGLFKEYHDMGYPDDDLFTQKLLKVYHSNDSLDYLYIQNEYGNNDPSCFKYQSEAEIRNYGLQFLLGQDLDYILLLDADEIYTVVEIKRLIKFIEFNNLIFWFRIEFKNLTFNQNTYTKGFNPPRIFICKHNGFSLKQIFWDNDFLYTKNGEDIDYRQLSSVNTPTSICNPLHFTWLNDEVSKRKIEYQKIHFQHGAGCAFDWDNDRGLIWNEEYFKKTGQPIPQLYNYEH